MPKSANSRGPARIYEPIGRVRLLPQQVKALARISESTGLSRDALVREAVDLLIHKVTDTKQEKNQDA